MASTQTMTRPTVQMIKAQLQSDGMVKALQDAVPLTARKYLPPERVVRIVTAALNKTPQLLQCEPNTILSSVVELVQLGLEPGGPLGQAYLVPYGRTCTPIVGYQGYIALARRSGEIASIFAQVAYELDEFEVQFGDEPHVLHKPNLRGERGEPIAVYCVATFKSGEKHIEVMTVVEIEAVRKRSRAGNSGPWQTDWSQMARKTVIRRARHYWPISVEMAQAAELDDRVDTGAYVVDGGTLGEPEVQQPKTAKLAARLKPQPEPAHDPQTGEVQPDADYLDEQARMAEQEMREEA